MISCPRGNLEGLKPNQRPTDADDNFCFPGTEALRVRVNGCTDTNTGFDGASYLKIWPGSANGNFTQPIMFGSPLTGPHHLIFGGGGATHQLFNSFRSIMPNRCRR